jgi:hypothetical protein
MLIKKILNSVNLRDQKNNRSLVESMLMFLANNEDGKIWMANTLASTPTGVTHLIESLHCEVRPGDSTKNYLVAGQYDVKASDVSLFSGVIAKGYPVPPRSVDTEVIRLDTCASCGTSCPDVDFVTSNYYGTDDVTCNHCRTYMRDIDSSKVGNISTCQSCAKVDCSHHPKKSILVQADLENQLMLDYSGYAQVP